jgi:putative hydrolase of the HAD superfamily
LKGHRNNPEPAQPDPLADCDTLMLDMDGTLLDLAFDNYVWLEVVPREYALAREMPEEDARRELYSTMQRLRGTLDWYCLEFWSDTLQLDLVALHRDMNHRIGYLPGARDFLQRARTRQLRMLLVTNSHRITLQLKDEVTEVTQFFDEVYTSHDIGAPKEEQPFWERLMEREAFDPARTLFVDDNLQVLDSARRYGVQKLVAVSRPDTREPERKVDGYQSVDGVSRLIED